MQTNRKAKPHQKKPARLLCERFPQCDYRDGEAEKKQGRIDKKMFSDKREKFQRMKPTPWLTPPRDFRCANRRPGAFLVPSYRRHTNAAKIRSMR